VRSTALAVLIGTGSDWSPFPSVKANFFWRGLGTSDHMALAGALSSRFDYTNSYYHRFPRLDLTSVEADLHGFFGFVVCSDVLEHIPMHVDTALIGIRDLLAPHGFAVLSVPNGGADFQTKEFYPDLVDWEEHEGFIEWTDSQGRVHTDRNPEFHGGVGRTLAFRVWGGNDFRRQLLEAGMRIVNDVPFCPELGVPPVENHGVFLAYR
jgi:hypothetical protein